MSGAAAGAVMVARHGPRQMAGSAVVGGVLLGLIEGMSKYLEDTLVFGCKINISLPQEKFLFNENGKKYMFS